MVPVRYEEFPVSPTPLPGNPLVETGVLSRKLKANVRRCSGADLLSQR